MEALAIVRPVVARLGLLRDEDAIGDGLLGYAEALAVWDDSHGVPFDAYARARVRWRILEARRRWTPATTETEIDYLPSPDDPELADRLRLAGPLNQVAPRSVLELRGLGKDVRLGASAEGKISPRRRRACEPFTVCGRLTPSSWRPRFGVEQLRRRSTRCDRTAWWHSLQAVLEVHSLLAVPPGQRVTTGLPNSSRCG